MGGVVTIFFFKFIVNSFQLDLTRLNWEFSPDVEVKYIVNKTLQTKKCFNVFPPTKPMVALSQNSTPKHLALALKVMTHGT